MNIADTLRASASRTPSKTALICQDRSISYVELDFMTDALAAWFLDQEGISAGDRIAIHWCNSIETVALYYACFKAGLIAVPLNNRLKAPELAYILQHAGCRLCFSQPDLADSAVRAAASLPANIPILTALPPVGTDSPHHRQLPPVRPDRVAAILYTSGTTAQPKGVMHTHISLVGMIELMRSLGLSQNDVVMPATQMLHIAALGSAILPGLALGCTCVLLPLFDPAEALNLMARWGVTYTLALPALLQFIVEEKERLPRRIESLRICLVGGDSVPVATQHRFRELFGTQIREIYAMTESCPLTCIPAEESRPGSIGKALEIIETRVVDALGNTVPAGQIGELQVMSPASCVGYWNNPEATDDAFVDGWLRTGDLVSRDTDGFFWFHARLKEIIVRGGSNIAPQEVEACLYRHASVLEAAVVGLPDPVWGEQVVAFVAVRESHTRNEPELIDFMRHQIAEYKVPARIHFLPSLPKGLTGKVQRQALKDLAKLSTNP